MGISISQKGNFNRTEHFLNKARRFRLETQLAKYGDAGVAALASATPVNSGLTSGSWTYEIRVEKEEVSINWFNTNVNDGYNIAMGIQYGHGTRSGSYVHGIDYINPALQPVFDKITEDVWNEIQNW